MILAKRCGCTILVANDFTGIKFVKYTSKCAKHFIKDDREDTVAYWQKILATNKLKKEIK